MIACTIIIILTLVRSSSRAGSTSARRSRRRRNISVMLITVNLVFISLTAPIVIFLSVVQPGDDDDKQREALVVLIKIFCIILMNLNHSVNIVIYSVTAKEFRSEMTNFLHACLYCIVGRPINPNDLPNNPDDGTVLSRLRRFRHNVFKCCRMKVHSNSTNTTDSSGLQHTVAPPPPPNQTRLSNSKNVNKCRRLERNGNRECPMSPNAEPLTNKCNNRLTVHLQADPISSVYEREDVSFHGLSVSTED